VTDHRSDVRRERMRELTPQGHAGQTRNGGRVPYWVPTDAVADICDQALRLTGELPPDEAEDLELAAHGHDLYEDTEVSATAIREQFGARVDGWIDALTNRKGDRDRADYLRHLAESDDETRIVKCADLIDNMLSVAYGLHDVTLDWARDYFRPIADETRAVLLSTPFTRLPRTGVYLIGLVNWAGLRLTGSMETSATIAASPGEEMAHELDLTPAAREMIERLTFTKEEWEESKAAVEAEEERKAKKLFGERGLFPILDYETDS